MTSLLAATGGPGAFGALEIDIVPVALAGAPNALPVEFIADALVPLELCAKKERGKLTHQVFSVLN